MNHRYLEYAVEQLKEIDRTQQENMDKASDLMMDSLLKGGIIQTFGSGHSFGLAREVAGRAGGLVAAKVIYEPAMGIYESVEGVGTILMQKVEVLPEDTVMIISTSGRNPLSIEIAGIAKEKGAKVIIVTSMPASINLKSRHSSGKLLYEYADAILDTRVPEGDATMEVDQIPVKVCPISTVAGAALIQATVLMTIEKMADRGTAPDIRMSANLDGGKERSLKLQEKYAHRIFRS